MKTSMFAFIALILLSLSISFTSCTKDELVLPEQTEFVETDEVSAESNKTQYLDLSIDPVVPGGITAQQEKQMLATGWTKEVLKSDFYADVQFKTQGGKYYRKKGWLPAGTIVFVDQNNIGNDGGIVLRYCTNVEYDWRVLVHLW